MTTTPETSESSPVTQSLIHDVDWALSVLQKCGIRTADQFDALVTLQKLTAHEDQVSRIPEAVARAIAYSLDGEFHDGEGLFFGASVSGSTVNLTVQDAESDEQEAFVLTIEATK